MSPDVELACEQLVKALRDLAAGSSQEEAVATVRSTARAYADAIAEATGWTDVFADLDEEDSEPYDEVERVSVTGRWDFVVEDPEAFMRHAYDRLIENGWPEDAAAEHSESPAAALDTLLSLDGWDARRYDRHGAKASGQIWTARHVDRTLWEMSHTEQWRARF
ncbi:hypothetical protein ACWENQ_07510 [Nonomuraea sp. NPDC004354]